jgi:hypothetical protein
MGIASMCAEPQAETKRNSYRVPTHFLVAVRSACRLGFVKYMFITVKDVSSW